MDKERFQAMVENIYFNMNNILVNEESRCEVQQLGTVGDELDENFFIAELIAFSIQFQKLTGESQDLLDFIATLNRFAYQYLYSDLS